MRSWTSYSNRGVPRLVPLFIRNLDNVFPGITVVAKTITELIRFEPEVCICKGN